MNENDKKIDILIAHALQTNKRLDSIDDNLSEHMKRSAAVEKRQDLIESEVKPLLEHFQGFKWTLSALVVVTTVVKLLDILKIFH